MTKPSDKKQAIRGHLAFLIADIPAHENRPLDELLAIVDSILALYVIYRRGRQ